MDLVQRLSSQFANNSDDSSPINEIEPDIVILGSHYKPCVEAKQGQQDNDPQTTATGFFSNLFNKHNSMDPTLLCELRRRLHFTYRTRFTPIQRASDGPSPINFQRFLRDSPLNSLENAISNPDCFTTDIGWGCMIRTGQSLLGNALLSANLGNETKANIEFNDLRMGEKTTDIISWFQDTPEAPFSLHNFVDKGSKFNGMKPGEWFGPAATSTSIQKLVSDFPGCGIDNCLVSVSSGDIFECDVEATFNKKQDSNILFLLGVKLGINTVNESYWQDIVKILDCKYSVGIAGGRPSSSLYFFGYQGNDLIYFDPHHPQPCLEPTIFDSCHTTDYGKLNFRDMDPSMLIGIFIKGGNEWEDLKQICGKITIINIQDSHYSDIDGKFDQLDVDSLSSNDNETSEIQRKGSLGSEYIDIEPINKDDDDSFEKVNCKTQNIVIMKNTGCSENLTDMKYDVEPVLVEQNTSYSNQ